MSYQKLQPVQPDALPTGHQGLGPEEQQVLARLLESGKLTHDQAEHALQIHQLDCTPLLSILGALNYVHPRDYAAALAEIEGMAYVSELVGTEHLYYDETFVHKFDPPQMIRYLFFPLSEEGKVVTVLAVNPEEPAIASAIEAVVPGAEVIVQVGTERDVTKLLHETFHEEFLHKAVNHLREERPDISASRVFTKAQLIGFGLILAVFVASLVFDFWGTARLFITLISVLYIAAIGYKFALTLFSLFNGERRVPREEIASLKDSELPIYSILVPVYKEPQVVPRLLKALSRVDYPHEKLDVLLLMEEDDEETITQARAARPPSFFRFIFIPDSLPRTKPKACNYGLNFCRGKYVTIYDAEDIPEPDQLKKAVTAFRHGDDSLICVQAGLNYFNSGENYLTSMFTLEYSYWFDCLLPGLDRLGLPIPLGGTSNHFVTDKLWKLGAWDPFNVTEDADLGIRASVEGYTVGVIPSTTYEEANKAYKNWIRQRSRWIKGYMQTWLVHNRTPFKLLKTIGFKDWLSYNFFIGGTFWIFLINPLMWVLFAIWLLFRPEWMSILFHGWVWDLAMFSLIVGNLMAIVMNGLAGLRRHKYRLTLLSITNPLYWVLHSIAAYMGLWQLITKPFYWEKTNHGLTEVEIEPEHLFGTEAQTTAQAEASTG